MISPVEEPVSNINACPNLCEGRWIYAEVTREVHSLVSTVSDGDYTLALAIPLQILPSPATKQPDSVHASSSIGKDTHTWPVMTLYSPLSVCSSPSVSQIRTSSAFQLEIPLAIEERRTVTHSIRRRAVVS